MQVKCLYKSLAFSCFERCFIRHKSLVQDGGRGFSILPLVHSCQDIWIFMQAIGYEAVVAAKRHFHPSEGMRFAGIKSLCSPQNGSQFLSTNSQAGGPVKQSRALPSPSALLGSAPSTLILADLHMLLQALYQSNLISLRNTPFLCPHFCADCPHLPHAQLQFPASTHSAAWATFPCYSCPCMLARSPRLDGGVERKVEWWLWAIPKAVPCFTTCAILQSKLSSRTPHPLPPQCNSNHSEINALPQELMGMLTGQGLLPFWAFVGRDKARQGLMVTGSRASRDVFLSSK